MERISHSPDQLEFSFFNEDSSTATAPNSKTTEPVPLKLASEEEDPAPASFRNDPTMRKAIQRAKVIQRQHETCLTEGNVNEYSPGEIPAYLLGRRPEPPDDQLLPLQGSFRL